MDEPNAYPFFETRGLPVLPRLRDGKVDGMPLRCSRPEPESELSKVLRRRHPEANPIVHQEGSTEARIRSSDFHNR